MSHGSGEKIASEKSLKIIRDAVLTLREDLQAERDLCGYDLISVKVEVKDSAEGKSEVEIKIQKLSEHKETIKS